MQTVMLALVLALALSAPSPAQSPAPSVKFTVDEERAYTTFESETLPTWKKDLENAAGKPVELSIDWTTFAGDATVWEYLQSVSAVRCPVDAIAATCGDAVGKKRFAAAVKKLVLRHDRTIKDQPDKPGKGIVVELKDGTLTITDNWALNHLMTGDVQPLIEKLL